MTAATFLQAVSRRLRRRDGLWIAGAALIVGALVFALAARSLWAAGAGVAAGAAVLVVMAIGVWQRRHRWPAPAAARLVEAHCPGLENLLVTAVASDDMPGLSPTIRAEITRQADLRVAALSPAALVPLRHAAATVVLGAAIAAGVVTWAGRVPVTAPRAQGGAGAADHDAFEVNVTVTAPAYLRTAPVTVPDASDVRVPAGSTLRLVVHTHLPAVTLDDAAGAALALERGISAGTFERTWAPTQSTASALVARAADGTIGASRLLVVTVVPDEPPTVRVVRPGGDLRLPSADAPIPIEVEATDDHGVAALELRYVRMAGSGESFTFGEGRVPLVDVTAAGPHVRGRLTWSLRALGLAVGESLVYRVVARDDAPGAPPGESESYTIDIGPAFETAGAGAAVAEEDRRYAISQQMVIVHTERALAERDGATGEAWLARTQAIAAEQRMVRAEVVFLSGGEVEDEVEEAARGDEVQEGRLENRGRAEMLRAMGEMSRAEAQLTAGAARAALVFERRALSALLAAFDRRRYFLRTVPERSRIDETRRLTGDRRLAAPGLRVPGDRVDALGRERALLFELAAADSVHPAPAALAARVAALEPGASQWSRLAAALLAAPDGHARRLVVADIAGALRQRVSAARPAEGPAFGGRDLLEGWWTEELRAGGRQ